MHLLNCCSSSANLCDGFYGADVGVRTKQTVLQLCVLLVDTLYRQSLLLAVAQCALLPRNNKLVHIFLGGRTSTCVFLFLSLRPTLPRCLLHVVKHHLKNKIKQGLMLFTLSSLKIVRKFRCLMQCRVFTGPIGNGSSTDALGKICVVF